MLIVNADDFGAAPSATDAILTAWCQGAITSASAMVWMPDSERAAGLAASAGLPLGLHLNLTLPFRARDIPDVVRDRQGRLAALFGRESWLNDEQVAAPAQLIHEALEDQLERYRELYGEPTHINGHHHVHVHRSVLEALPRTFPVRPVLRVPSRAWSRPDARERRLRRRFVTATVALGFEHLHPALGGDGFDVLEPAGGHTVVEVMTHPQQSAELEALLSAEWRAVMARLQLGSYADLSARRGTLDAGVG